MENSKLSLGCEGSLRSVLSLGIVGLLIIMLWAATGYQAAELMPISTLYALFRGLLQQLASSVSEMPKVLSGMLFSLS